MRANDLTDEDITDQPIPRFKQGLPVCDSLHADPTELTSFDVPVPSRPAPSFPVPSHPVIPTKHDRNKP